MKKILTITVIGFCLLVIGCSSSPPKPGAGVKFSQISSSLPTPTRPASEIDVYITKKPETLYKELGFLIVEFTDDDEALVIQRMREKASMIGAHAIIVMPSSTVTEEWRGRSYVSNTYKSIAIEYKK